MAGSTSGASSSTSSGTVVNGRYWGLASGLDVDSIVTGIVSDDQSKIDKQQQAQQTLQWKQQSYRDVIDKLNTFENSYLEMGAATSMARSEMYCSYTANASNSDFTVSANADATGAAQYIKVTQTATTAALSGGTLGSTITGKPLSNIVGATLSNKSFSMTIDGVTKTITFTPDDINNHTSNGSVKVKELLQAKIDTAFGDGKVVVGPSGDTGNLTISNAGGIYANDEITVNSGSPNDALSALGFKDNSSNRLDQSESLGTFLGDSSASGSMTVIINGTKVTLDKSKNVATALAALNSAGTGVTLSYDNTTDKFSITSNQSGAAGSFTFVNDDVDGAAGNTTKLMNALKIDESTNNTAITDITDSNGKVTAYQVKGQDAQIQLSSSSTFSASDTQSFDRSSNTFSINGVSYNIGNVDSTDSSKNTCKVSFTTDSSKLQTGIQGFIAAYNTLISDIHTQIDTAPDSNYPPLTDAQKTNMTSTEITQWNTKAQQGMLFGDDTLQGVLDEMRTVLYKGVTLSDGSTFSLFNIGVTTSDDPDDYGKLEVKPVDLSTFQDACNTESSKIKQLFTKTSSIPLNISAKADPAAQQQRTEEEGLADRLNDIVQKSAGDVNSTFGSIVQIAGTTSLNQFKNTIYNELKEISDNITTLKTNLKDKKNRLYAQFTKLETFMAKANAESSQLSSLGS